MNQDLRLQAAKGIVKCVASDDLTTALRRGSTLRNVVEQCLLYLMPEIETVSQEATASLPPQAWSILFSETLARRFHWNPVQDLYGSIRAMIGAREDADEFVAAAVMSLMLHSGHGNVAKSILDRQKRITQRKQNEEPTNAVDQAKQDLMTDSDSQRGPIVRLFAQLVLHGSSTLAAFDALRQQWNEYFTLPRRGGDPEDDWELGAAAAL